MLTAVFTGDWRDLSWRTTPIVHTEEDDDALASIHRCQAWQRPWRVKAA